MKSAVENTIASTAHRASPKIEINYYGHFVPLEKRKANGFRPLKYVPLEHCAETFLSKDRLSRISHENAHKFLLQSKGSVVIKFKN